MGIRESLKQPDDLKLQDFSIKEEKQEEISIENLISQVDWSKLVDILDVENQEDYGTTEYFASLANYRIIDPEEFDNIFTEDKDILWDLNVADHLENWKNKNLGLYITTVDIEKHPELENGYVLERIGEEVIARGKFLEAIKHLYPQDVKEINLPNSNWDKVLEELDNIRRDKDYVSYVETMATALQLFPHRQKELRAICRELLPEFIEDLRFQLENKNPLSMLYFISQAAKFRIVFPDEKPVDIFNQNTFAKVYETLQQDRNKNDYIFISNLADLKIIISQDIVITEQGLELVPPEKEIHQKNISPRPERRNS